MISAKLSKRDSLEVSRKSSFKFANVESVIDTGSSVTKFEKRQRHIHKDIKYRPNEIYQRIRPEALGRRILEAAETFDLQQLDRQYFGPIRIGSCLSTPYPCGDLEYRTRSLASTVRATPRDSRSREGTSLPEDSTPRNMNARLVGLTEDECQGDVRVQDAPQRQLPFLLLDTRDSDAYGACHIITARHYPSAMMSKASNQLTREIYDYRNKPERMIIVYDEDETVAVQVANFFCERGIENVFLLSGGLNLLIQRVHGIILGELSNLLIKAIPSQKATPISAARSRLTTPSSRKVRELPGVARPPKPANLTQKVASKAALPLNFSAGVGEGVFDLKELSESLDSYALLIKKR